MIILCDLNLSLLPMTLALNFQGEILKMTILQALE